MNTIIGIILGIAIVILSFSMEGGELGWIAIPSAILLVVIGTLVVTLAGTNLTRILILPHLVAKAIKGNRFDHEVMIRDIVHYAVKAKRDGLLSLEKEVDNIESQFLKKIMFLCIDGIDKETYDHICESELLHLSERHEQNVDIFQRMAGFSPTMGVLGTIMALITTLANAGDDPDQMIRRIAFAFITTLWGIFMANMVWHPIADKLRNMHVEEMQTYKMMVDGVYGIICGENPRIVRSRLAAFLTLEQQERFIDTRNHL